MSDTTSNKSPETSRCDIRNSEQIERKLLSNYGINYLLIGFIKVELDRDQAVPEIRVWVMISTAAAPAHKKLTVGSTGQRARTEGELSTQTHFPVMGTGNG